MDVGSVVDELLGLRIVGDGKVGANPEMLAEGRENGAALTCENVIQLS